MKAWLVTILLISSFAGASVEPEYKVLFNKASRAIRRSMTKPVLALVRAKQEKAPGCEEFLNWTYVFQSMAKQDPRVGGFVEYAMAPTQAGCERTERIVTDTALAGLTGYNYLANNQNLDRITVDWAHTRANIEKKYPAFAWQGSFEIYSPLVPGYSGKVFYAASGTLNGDPLQVIADAATGEVF